MEPPATVAILLCTYNGASHLEEQLVSLRGQQACDIVVVASDDGSSDGTVDQLRLFYADNPASIEVRQGPGSGHAANFLSLACDPGIEACYFAYADQDDYWDADKLARAVACLGEVSSSQPALYCSRTRSVSKDGVPLGLSPLFTREPSFRNALVQNIGGGNTMVFNAAARALLIEAGVVDVVSHDWWTYLLVCGAGGRVVYDRQPTLSYRQHEANEVGANLSLADRARRYLKAIGGRNRAWNDRNLSALRDNSHLLTAENGEILERFSRARQGGLFTRLQGLRQCGLYAQTLSGNIGLYAATLLKKI